MEIVESCLSEAIEVIEKEVEIEEEAVRKYREIEINREKNLEMGTVKLEIERMMRVEKGERLRKVAKKKEKEKVKKMAREMVGEIVSKIEKKKEREKKEEKRFEMWEIRDEIVRLMRIEKASELSKKARERFKLPINTQGMEKMETDISESEFNRRKRETTWGEIEIREWRETNQKNIMREETEIKRRKRQEKTRLVEQLNRESREKYERGASENMGTIGMRKRKKPGGKFKYILRNRVELESRGTELNNKEEKKTIKIREIKHLVGGLKRQRDEDYSENEKLKREKGRGRGTLPPPRSQKLRLAQGLLRSRKC